MIEKITFENSNGDIFTSAENGIYANYNDLRDYLWEYDSENDIITKFSRGIVTKTLPLIILCDSEEEGISVRNSLLEIADVDVVAQTPGKFTINGYYLQGYIIGSTKTKYLYNKRYMEVELTFLTDQPYWVKETTYQFQKDNKSSEGKTYDYTYDYTYGSNIGNAYISLNDALSNCNFKMIIYGSVTNPQITIGGWLYNVNVTLSSSDYLVIDSKEKTAIVVDSKGNETNVFNYRNFTYSPFTKLNTGYSSVSWSGGFGFDLITYEERSEPKWT